MDRTALITGGTGGLGRAVVEAFASDGWRVAVLDRGTAQLEGAEVVQADLTEPGEVERAVAAAAAEPGAPLAAVVNLVGGFAGGQPVAATPVSDFEAQFTRNLRPTYLVTQAALPALTAAGAGAIVCVSSRSALHPFAGAAGYCASKAAVITFAQVVAREHAADGIRCNAVLPQMIDTPANRAAMPPEEHAALTPPAEIAAVIRFLCSPDSAPTTGAAIPVYGRP
ncbi:MAG TPA: SDR family NAD(P)-dependent oxidoreductase [Solirubrobacteraceae bacterium]|jgi:NAD(P)-dependent dehydrogenase (short-subunit alcohol dehydrogenase family)|nr:SDR family NAD(P)-dependent oxidoreductase [Solirubrobacteraceae bacterium]